MAGESQKSRTRKRSTKPRRSRWPVLFFLLALGAGATAVGQWRQARSFEAQWRQCEGLLEKQRQQIDDLKLEIIILRGAKHSD